MRLVRKVLLVTGEFQVTTEVLVVKDPREGLAMMAQRESLGRRGRRVNPEPRLTI